MIGIIIDIAEDRKNGIVDTRNDEYGRLTIYAGKRIPDTVHIGDSVQFEIRTSVLDNRYARFISVVRQNAILFNTEDRDQWYTWGEDCENDFLQRIVPRLGIDIRKNPEKEIHPWAIDLFDYTNRRPADLKTQSTPFFTAGYHKYYFDDGREINYNPSFTVTFNKKDYENYRENHHNCDIYFWVDWRQTSYINGNNRIDVEKIYGVWRAPFEILAGKIQRNEVTLHAYHRRVDDDHNAKDSYLFNLNDANVFLRLL